MAPRGRPPKPATERKRRNVTVAFHDALKDKMDAAAEASGRSLSSEIQHRLAQYNQLERAYGIATSDPEVQTVNRDMSLLRDIVTKHSKGQGWTPEQETIAFFSAMEWYAKIKLAGLLDGEAAPHKIEQTAKFMSSEIFVLFGEPGAMIQLWQDKVDAATDHVERHAAQQTLDMWKAKAE